MKNRSMCSFFAFLVLLLPPCAGAQTFAVPGLPPHDPVRLEFIDAGAGGLGLQVTLAPGWKFYWRTPGEGGVPPRFDWSDSRNLAEAHVAWPAPSRITIGDADLYGYTGQLILPISITRKRVEAAVGLSLRVEYGVCKDICILREDHLHHEVGAGSAVDSGSAARLAFWRARVPRPGAEAGVRLLSRSAAGGRLTIVLSSERPMQKPDLLVEGPPEAWYGRPDVTLSADHRQAEFVLPVTPGPAGAAPLTMTLSDTGLAVEIVSAKP